MLQFASRHSTSPTTHRTALCMDAGAAVVYDDKHDDDDEVLMQGETFPSFFSADLAKLASKSPPLSAHISQTTIHQADLRRGCRLLHKLGAGSFGTAYLCQLGAPLCPYDTSSQVVIKLPNDVLTRLAKAHAMGLLTGLVHASHVMERLDTRHAIMKTVRAEFTEEMHNAEAFLEPTCLHAMRAAAYGLEHRPEEKAPWVGLPLKDLSAVEYLRYLKERTRLRTHPGFYHMHQVLHFDASIPAILSDYADGSLRDLQKLCLGNPNVTWLDAPTLKQHAPVVGNRFPESVSAVTPPPLWTQIAAQMAAAVDYMRTFSPITHVDLKPGNVLFRLHGQGGGDIHQRAGADALTPPSIRCMVSDYGMCKPKDGRIDSRGGLPGTAFYNPPLAFSRGKLWLGTQTVLWQYLTFFQFFTCLADLLLFRESPDTVPQSYFINSLGMSNTIDQSLIIACLHEVRPQRAIRTLWGRLKYVQENDNPHVDAYSALFILMDTLIMRNNPYNFHEAFDNFKMHIEAAYAVNSEDDSTRLQLKDMVKQAKQDLLQWETSHSKQVKAAEEEEEEEIVKNKRKRSQRRLSE